MAQFPCLPLWTDSWVADTAHLSRLERGTYIDLLVLMWRTPGCRVPNDNVWLARHLRLTVAEIETDVRSIINEFCQTDGNWISQKRLKREFVRQFEFNNWQKENAAKRWRPHKQRASVPDKSLITQAPTPCPRRECHLPYPKEEEESLSLSLEGARRPKGKNQKDPARSLATALDGSALTRSPDTEPAEPKQEVADKHPKEMTLTELNRRWRGNGMRFHVAQRKI